MRVYELMSLLAECSSGAIVKCSAALTVSELESGERLGENGVGNNLYAVDKDIASVESSESVNDFVYLNF